MSSSLKIAVCGLGRIGWRHAALCKKLKGLSLVSVCDQSFDLLKKAGNEFNVETHSSYDEMLATSDADMIVIALPSHLHKKTTIAALKAKFHVLVEKPAADSAADMKAMMDAAKKNRRTLTIHQCRRFQPDHLEVKKIIDSGAIGTPYHIYIGTHDFNERNDWQTLKKFGGGALANWGVHLVDNLLELTDKKPKKVSANLWQIQNGGDAEDAFKISVQFERGLLGEVEVTKSYYGKPLWQICGDKGSIQVDATMPNLKIRTRTHTGKETIKTLDFLQIPSNIEAFYKDFTKRARKGDSPAVSAKSVYTQLKIIDAARISARKDAAPITLR